MQIRYSRVAYPQMLLELSDWLARVRAHDVHIPPSPSGMFRKNALVCHVEFVSFTNP